jgi:hypothetical protein
MREQPGRSDASGSCMYGEVDWKVFDHHWPMGIQQSGRRDSTTDFTYNNVWRIRESEVHIIFVYLDGNGKNVP